MLNNKVPPLLGPLYQAFAEADPQGVLACFTPSAEVRTSSGAVFRGRDEIRVYFDQMVAISRSMELHRQRFITMPGALAAASEVTRPLPDRGPGRFLFTSIQIYEFDPEGQIIRMLAFFDVDGAIPMG